ncbi:hypothetical protein PDE_09664 [Penicillium oxalicum 114-2]|uniref:Uncharacterized protein n=1 Tax=Penicillium oxalicum (strain 114-2 / CGMCC 5302) TaxID=933388 RepID=S7ZVC7_PENO1|nr:hypothetical protein PDE_09664 [Penicillium oxalicum 114-2]
MFSATSARDRLRRSMSSRSMRRARPSRDPVPINVKRIDTQALAAASRAMRTNAASSDSKAYDRVGGPAQVAIPKRRPGSSLRYSEEEASFLSNYLSTSGNHAQTFASHAGDSDCPTPNPAALPPITEPLGLDGRLNSRASSYRRLRKAKSMFTPRGKSSQSFYPSPAAETPRNAFELDRSQFHLELDLPRTLRPSPSPFSIKQQHSHGIRHAKSHDAAIELARSQFAGGSDSPALNQKASSSFYRRNKEQRAFRKTLRAASDKAPNLHSSPSAKWSSRSKSRKLSASIKSRFRRVFGISKPIEQEPVQISLDADTLATPVRGPLIDTKPAVNRDRSLDLSTIPSPLQAESPGGASLHTVTSRVTSWADSSVANTVKTRNTRHRQSLSLIEEHGDLNKHLPELPDQAPETPAAQESIHSGLNGQLSPSAIQNWANSNDLYSALMQQIRERDTRSPDEELVFGTVPQRHAIPERLSSMRSRHTVRRVASEESSIAGSFATACAQNLKSPRCRQSQRLSLASTVTRNGKNTQSSRQVGESSVIPRSSSTLFSGDETDEDTGSVVVGHLIRSKTLEDSPSIYSRTTSDDTPKESPGRMITDILDNETGTATIFASQRTTYSSPNRLHDHGSSEKYRQPSVDWRKWMSTEIGRIENTSPVREHFREAAQGGSEDEDRIFAQMLKQRAASQEKDKDGICLPTEEEHIGAGQELKRRSSSRNNFSRPFSRSSSVRTVLPSQESHPLAHENPAQPSIAEEASNSPLRSSSARHVSVLRTMSSNKGPESPTRKGRSLNVQKRRWTQEQYRRYSTRRPLTVGASSNVRSMCSYQASLQMHDENIRQQEEYEDLMDDYLQLQDIHSTVSSKRMVDIFLDSRRQQKAETAPNDTNDGEAFI